MDWVAVLAPARWALRRYRASATALALSAALGVAAATLPVVTERLRVPAVPDGGWAPAPGPLARSAAATQRRGVASLAELTRGLGLAALAAAGLTIVVVSVARASTRRPDVVVRRAVGASRRVLAGAHLVEGGAIAAAGVGVGVLTGTVTARYLIAVWPGDVAPGAAGQGSLHLGLATGGVIVLGALLPLVHIRRGTVQTASGGEQLWLPVAVLQLGLGLATLALAGHIARQAAVWTAVGSVPAPVSWVVPVAAADEDPAARAATWSALLERVGRIAPGAGLTSPGAALGLGRVDIAVTDCGRCAQGGLFMPHHAVAVVHHLVSPDSFRALGLTLLAGRGIAEKDVAPADRVAVVSARLARRHFEGGNAVGRLIRIGRGSGGWYIVVGIVGDRDAAGFGGAGQPQDAVYLSIAQHPPRAAELLVSGEAGRAAAALADSPGSWSAGPPATLAALREVEAAPARWFARVIRLEGWAALAAAAIGTFAVMRLWVGGLVPELAVRRAVGATRQQMLNYVAVRACAVAAGGVLTGAWLGPIVTEAGASVVPGMPAMDVRLATAPMAALVLATFVAALVPAWRATRAAPMEHLGHAGP